MRTYSLLTKKIKNIFLILSCAVLISSSLAYVVNAATFTDTYEPNNSLEEAIFIVSGENYDSYISGFYDVDFYKVHVTRAGTITATLTNLPLDYDIYLLDNLGNELAYSVNEGITDEKITFNAAPII
jgi:bacillolysin